MIVQWVNVEHALRIMDLIIDIKIMHVFVVAENDIMNIVDLQKYQLCLKS